MGKVQSHSEGGMSFSDLLYKKVIVVDNNVSAWHGGAHL
jgi:hypothetical protein